MTQNTQEPIRQIHFWSDGGRAAMLVLDGLAVPVVANAQAGQASVFEGSR